MALGIPLSRRGLAVLLWSALGCWAAVMLWLSSLSPAELPESAFWMSDKVNHVLAYAVGGWLATQALNVSRPHMPVAARIALAILLIAAFGAFDESLQRFTPGRTGGSVGDWVADILGATVGALSSLLRRSGSAGRHR